MGDIAELEVDDTTVEGEGLHAAVLEKEIGNAMSFYFASRSLDESTGLLPFNVQPQGTKRALESLPSMGTVHVERRTKGNHGDFEWIVEFVTRPGNLTLLVVEFVSELGGVAVYPAVSISKLTKGHTCGEATDSNVRSEDSFAGNPLGGFFVIAALASSEDVENAIHSGVGRRIGPVEVRRLGPDETNGYTWIVTIAGLAGDLELMAVDGSLLTGTDAPVSVEEVLAGISTAGTFTLTFEDGGQAVPLGLIFRRPITLRPWACSTRRLTKFVRQPMAETQVVSGARHCILRMAHSRSWCRHLPHLPRSPTTNFLSHL